MNGKDGRSIDWRWGSLIPLSADDGVYGDQNKSVKKARDDAKGKFADIFLCSGRLEASLIFLSMNIVHRFQRAHTNLKFIFLFE